MVTLLIQPFITDTLFIILMLLIVHTVLSAVTVFHECMQMRAFLFYILQHLTQSKWCLYMYNAQHIVRLLPAALRAAQARRYLIYSEANFEVFRPAGATRCTDGGEIWRGWGDLWSPPPRQISPPSVQRQGCRTPKTENFTQILPLSPSITPSRSFPAQDLPCSRIFPTIDSLPASGLTPRLYDWSVSSEHLGFYSARNARIASAVLDY